MLFVWSIASIVYTVCWLIGTLIFLKRRNIEPIRSRGWELVMISNLISVIHFIYLCAILDLYRALPTFDCNVLVWEGSLFIPIWTGPYIVRTFLLYFKYRLETEKNQNERKETTWFHSHLYLISLRYLFLYFFLLASLIFIVAVFFQLLSPKPGDFDLLVQCFNLQRIPLVIGGFASTCLVLLLAFLVMPVKDTFFIKGELAIVAFLTPPFFITFLVMEWLNLIPDFKYLLLLTALVLNFLILIVYPIFLSFRHQKLAYKVSMSENDAYFGLSSQEIFEICLSNTILFEAFRQHCVESFCVENALFYRDALNYQALDEKHRKTELTNIRTLYLKENARLLINILGKTRTSILEEANRGNCPPDLLDLAMKEVFQQMYQDTFPKFKVSTRFQQAWKKAKIEKKNSVTLKSNKSRRSSKSRKESEDDDRKSFKGGSKISLSVMPSKSDDPIVEPVEDLE